MKKYYVSVILKRIGIVILFLSLNILLHAQSDPLKQEDKEWTDTIKELRYELDTTTQGEPADTIKEEEYAADLNDENKDEQEYFLRKEFTGGLPDTLKFRRLPDNVIKALREDKAFWYANETFKKREKKKEKVSFTAHPVFQTVLWLIIISGFATFLILYLRNSNVGLFRKSSNITDEEAGIETSDIFLINYQK